MAAEKDTCCCAVAGAAAQTLAGRICDEDGGPVAYATLFCRADGKLLNIRLAAVNAVQTGALGARRRVVCVV